LGAPCAWQDIGVLEVTSDGTRVQCVYEDGAYHWRRPPTP
jgi:hypothetical protein